MGGGNDTFSFAVVGVGGGGCEQAHPLGGKREDGMKWRTGVQNKWKDSHLLVE